MTRHEWGAVVAEEQRKGDQTRCRILNRANMPARYASEAAELAFKENVAKHGLSGNAAYEAVCRRHPCKGETIPDDRLPPHLVRVMSENAWRRSVGDDGASQRAPVRDSVGVPPHRVWCRAVRLTKEADWLPGPLENPAVFANLHGGDPSPAATGPQPGIVEQAKGHVGLYGSLADVLVWLTARRGTRKGAAMVLVSYGRRHVGHCHYPVPPDALGFQRFRPVPPGCDEPYGRSWPAGVEENDHLKAGNGVPEVAHLNTRVPADDVWCFGLGQTTLDVTDNG
jgi:hypothetical protein